MTKDLHTPDNESLIEFPCNFKLKAMGKNTETFVEVVFEIACKLVRLPFSLRLISSIVFPESHMSSTKRPDLSPFHIISYNLSTSLSPPSLVSVAPLA